MGQIDLTDILSVARALVDVDSTTGREGECMAWMARALRQAGYEVVEQDVEGSRRNVYAGIRPPRCGLVDAPRLRAAIFSEPRRG